MSGRSSARIASQAAPHAGGSSGNAAGKSKAPAQRRQASGRKASGGSSSSKSSAASKAEKEKEKKRREAVKAQQRKDAAQAHAKEVQRLHEGRRNESGEPEDGPEDGNTPELEGDEQSSAARKRTTPDDNDNAQEQQSSSRRRLVQGVDDADVGDEGDHDDNDDNDIAAGLANARNHRNPSPSGETEDGRRPGNMADDDDVFNAADDDEEEEEEEGLGDVEEELAMKGVEISQNAKKTKKRSPDSTSTSKVVEADFEGSVLSFAIAAKAYFRREASFGSAFPPRAVLERDQFLYDMLLAAAEEHDADTEDDDEEERWTHATYGKRQLLNNLMTAARPVVENHFGIPKEMEIPQIRGRVSWLLEKGRFRYGGISFQSNPPEYNRSAPYASSLVASVVRSAWFDGTKGERPAFDKMLELRYIPEETVILCFTVVECILKCWLGGSFVRIHFSEENCSARYSYFKDVWKKLSEKAPEYTDKLLEENFNRAIKQTKNSALLYTERDVDKDLEGINYDNLIVAAVGADDLIS
ncbi:hypothetical protein CPB83DRAFT_889929 [Crepidotus variabilis]|uniref:DUF6532 domain-containing protein n=1 Tax=Crepidotus variabilis TaxID=179855 RepID=A0A9P6JTR8_9AGAR|nr:hypothetical protein CPB83DRAFT_889929 [Crepidotus variabilis]